MTIVGYLDDTALYALFGRESDRLIVWLITERRALFWPFAGALVGMGACLSHIHYQLNPPASPDRMNWHLIRQHWRWIAFAASAGAVIYNVLSIALFYAMDLPFPMGIFGWIMDVFFISAMTYCGALMGFTIAYRVLGRRHRM